VGAALPLVGPQGAAGVEAAAAPPAAGRRILVDDLPHRPHVVHPVAVGAGHRAVLAQRCNLATHSGLLARMMSSAAARASALAPYRSRCVATTLGRSEGCSTSPAPHSAPRCHIVAGVRSLRFTKSLTFSSSSPPGRSTPAMSRYASAWNAQ